MKNATNPIHMMIIGLALVAILALAPPVAAVPLIEQPDAYLNPPDAFLMNDAVIHDGAQNGYQLEISRYTADKYIECDPTLKYLYLDILAGESQNDQVRLATKKALYPYTEVGPGNWYPGWTQKKIPTLADLNL
jgi:hypothetical protein